METDFRRLVASVARLIIANDANGAKQTREQRELVSLVGKESSGARWGLTWIRE